MALKRKRLGARFPPRRCAGVPSSRLDHSIMSFIMESEQVSLGISPVFISSPEFNLPLIDSFTWLMPPGPYRATTCWGKELISGSHTYFLDYTRTWRASPDEGSAQCRGHLRVSTNMKDDTHKAHTHTHSQSNKANMKWLTVRWYSGTFVCLKFSDITLTSEEKPRKHLIQETSHDWGSNPGPLRERRA